MDILTDIAVFYVVQMDQYILLLYLFFYRGYYTKVHLNVLLLDKNVDVSLRIIIGILYGGGMGT